MYFISVWQFLAAFVAAYKIVFRDEPDVYMILAAAANVGFFNCVLLAFFQWRTNSLASYWRSHTGSLERLDVFGAQLVENAETFAFIHG